MPIRIEIRYPDTGVTRSEKDVLVKHEKFLKDNLVSLTKKSWAKYEWKVQQSQDQTKRFTLWKVTPPIIVGPLSLEKLATMTQDELKNEILNTF